MSGTQECARCGGLVNAEGRCSVCGVTQELDLDGGSRRSISDTSGGARKESKVRPAFLFNKLTNDRHALTQSVSKIGRDQTNNISITNDHYISRHHAWVLQMQGGYWVEDLGSTNGTLLNGEILNERKQIFPGDRLTFGKTELVFVVE
ncbi:MAG TPA: FHA domain-containing protein [Planktothrix sp.]